MFMIHWRVRQLTRREREQSVKFIDLIHQAEELNINIESYKMALKEFTVQGGEGKRFSRQFSDAHYLLKKEILSKKRKKKLARFFSFQ